MRELKTVKIECTSGTFFGGHILIEYINTMLSNANIKSWGHEERT